MTGEIKGYLLDYGGTLDTAGCHWGKFIWHGYERCHVGVAWDDFREAYVHTERALGQGGIILPTMTFRETLATKIGMQIGRLREREALSSDSDTRALEERLLLDLYGEVLRQMETNRPVLAQLADRAPLALVSNFYGNLPTVVEEMGLRAPISRPWWRVPPRAYASPTPASSRSPSIGSGSSPRRPW